MRNIDPVGVVARVEADHINRLCESDSRPSYEIRLRYSMPVTSKIRHVTLVSLGHVLAPICEMLQLLKK